ncbi:SDR family oxidoreductase [Nonomuraea ferruginea]
MTEPSEWQRRIEGEWVGRPSLFDATGTWQGYEDIRRSSVHEDGVTTYYMDGGLEGGGPMAGRFRLGAPFAFGVVDSDASRIYTGPDFYGTGQPYGTFVDAHYYGPGWQGGPQHLEPGDRRHPGLLLDALPGAAVVGCFNGLYTRDPARTADWLAAETRNGPVPYILPTKTGGAFAQRLRAVRRRPEARRHGRGPGRAGAARPAEDPPARHLVGRAGAGVRGRRAARRLPFLLRRAGRVGQRPGVRPGRLPQRALRGRVEAEGPGVHARRHARHGLGDGTGGGLRTVRGRHARRGDARGADVVIVVTGGSRGIGRGLVREFLARGHQVVTCGSATAPEDGLGVVADVTDRAQVRELWDTAVAEYGRVDVWINNAGVTQRRVPLWELTEQETRAVVDVNLNGVINGCAVALAGMA